MKIAALIGLISIFGCARKTTPVEDLFKESYSEYGSFESIEETGSGQFITTSIDDAQTKVLIGKANLQLEEYDKAIEAFLEAQAINPILKDQISPFLADSYMLSGREKLRGFDYEGAISRFRRMIEIDFRRLDDTIADIVDAYKSYAKTKISEREIDEVFNSYDMFRRLSPNNPQIIMGAGEIAYSVARYSKALEFFDEVGDLDYALKPQADYFIGQIHLITAKGFLDRESYEKAIESLIQAKNSDNKLSGEVNALLVDAYMKYGEELNRAGNYEQAEAQWNKCIELAPDNIQVFKTLALFYTERGLDEKALKIYGTISDLEPDNLEILEKKADLTMKLRGVKNAQDIFVQIIGLDTKNHYTRFNKYLAEIHFDEVKYHSAVKYYLDYLNFYPQDAEAAFQIARAYSFTREYSLADEYLRQAVAIDRSWKEKPGFYWGFRLYQARAAIVIFSILLIAGLIAFIYYYKIRKKILLLHKAA